MSYADAINAAMRQHVQQLRDLGGLLAQAGMSPADAGMEGSDMEHIQAGYNKQREDFPNG